jgi:hypothetical protein
MLLFPNPLKGAFRCDDAKFTIGEPSFSLSFSLSFSRSLPKGFFRMLLPARGLPLPAGGGVLGTEVGLGVGLWLRPCCMPPEVFMAGLLLLGPEEV